MITSRWSEENTGSKKQGTEIGGGGRSPQEGAEISCCVSVGMANAGTPTLIHYTTQLSCVQLRSFPRLSIQRCERGKIEKKLEGVSPLYCRGSGMLTRSLAEGARFENPAAIETIGRDLLSSVQSQSLIEESKVDEKPIKPDRAQ